MAATIRLSQQHSCSLDHLVGAGEHARRQLKAERLCCLEVDDQLVLGGRLYRQIGRLLALENAIDVAGCAALLVDLISSIGDQAATGDESADGVDRGQPMRGRQRDYQLPATERRWARRND